MVSFLFLLNGMIKKIEDLNGDWRNGINFILNCNCIDLMKMMPDKCIDLVLTDIPYNEVNRSNNGLRNLNKGVADSASIDIYSLLSEITRVCNGSVYVFCGTEQVSDIRRRLVDTGFSTRLCVWEKTNPSPMNGEHIWLSGVECCVFGKRSGATFNEFCKTPVWRYPVANNQQHPTQKPLELGRYLVSVSSSEKGIIFDPFGGSFTFARAAKDMGFDFLSCDREEDYCRIGEERLKQECLF